MAPTGIRFLTPGLVQIDRDTYKKNAQVKTEAGSSEREGHTVREQGESVREEDRKLSWDERKKRKEEILAGSSTRYGQRKIGRALSDQGEILGHYTTL